MIREDEVVTLRYDLRSPVIVAAILGGHEGLRLPHTVQIHVPVGDLHLIPFTSGDSLDELPFRPEWVAQHDDLPEQGIAVLVGHLVDDEAILIRDRRGHRLALLTRDLDHKSHDEGRDDRLEEQYHHYAEGNHETPAPPNAADERRTSSSDEPWDQAKQADQRE